MTYFFPVPIFDLDGAADHEPGVKDYE